MTDSQAATLNSSQSYASQINWSGPTPSLPVAPKQPPETEEPAPAPPSAAEIVGGAITGEGILAGLGKGITTIGATLIGAAGTVITWCAIALTIPTDSPRTDTYYSKQDKPLSNGEIQKLKDAGVDVEGVKSPGGQHAGQQDLYKDNQGNIIVKPKGGNGPGEPTGMNINKPETWEAYK